MILTDRPLKELKEHPLNPRPKEKEPIAQMAKSIRQHGLLQPLCVKPDGMILSGHIRFWALTELGEQTAPCHVLDGEDEATALEILLVSNEHITAPDPLKEGDAVARLLALPGWTVAKVAEALGRQPRWVARRAQLRNLLPKIQEQIRAGKLWADWPVDWLERVAILSRTSQETLLKACTTGPDWQRRKFHSEAQLDELLATELQTLGSAPFDIHDAELAPKAGACVAKREGDSSCPKTTISRPELFETTVAGDVKSARCCDLGCWRDKVTASIKAATAAAKELHGGAVIVVAPQDYHARNALDKVTRDVGAMAHHEVTICKGTAKGAKPAVRILNNGGTEEVFVQTGAARTGTNDRGQPRTQRVPADEKSPAQKLKDSKEGIAKRRSGHVVDAVREAAEEKKLVGLKWDDLLQLLAAYSVNRPRQYVPGHEAEKLAKDQSELGRALWGRTREAVVEDLTRHSAHRIKEQERRARWLAPKFGLSLEELDSAAKEDIPDPKWWPAPTSPSTEGSKKPKGKKVAKSEWAGLSDAERLDRVNKIRKSKGLAPRESFSQTDGADRVEAATAKPEKAKGKKAAR